MSHPGIPNEVLDFITEHISSVEQLEVLLCTRAHSERDWSASEIALELRIATISAGDRLKGLADRGLLVGAGERFRYAPATPGLADAVTGLALAYRERRVTVIELIFSKPSDTIRIFADAFRIRKGR